MSSIEIYHKVYKDSNSCEVSCSDRFFITELREIVSKHEKVKEITEVKRKRMTFTTEEHNDIPEVLNAIVDSVPDLLVKTNVFHFFPSQDVVLEVLGYLLGCRCVRLGTHSRQQRRTC